MSAARDLYDRLVTEGEALIDQFVKEGEQESLFLDFKRARNDAAPMQSDDRKTLGETLSGFANAEGGVIVWGVDCRRGRNPDDPDEAQSPAPISNLRRWLSDLQTNTSQVVSPPVVAVEHHPIFKGNSDDNIGYAITYVPKGEGMPHMAIAKDQNVYFIRSGSSFTKMGSSQVADRYSRRPQPKLVLVLRLDTWREDHSVPANTYREYTFSIYLRNTGRGIAIYPAVRLRPRRFVKNSLCFPQNGFTEIQDHDGTLCTGGSTYVVYPGSQHILAFITFNKYLSPDIRSPDPALSFELYCDGYSGSGLLDVPIDSLHLQSGYELVCTPS